MFLSTRFGLGVDEAHYVLYGLHLDLSYVDHPPMVGWLEALSFKIFSGVMAPLTYHWTWAKDLIARMPAIVCGAIAHAWVQGQWKQLKIPLSQRLWMGCAFELLLIPFVMWMFFLPDTILTIFVLALCSWCFRVAQSTRSGMTIEWLVLGLILGLMGLSKYTAVLFLPGLLLIALKFRFLKRSKWYWILAGVVVAGLCVLPVMIWNYQHDWLSFKYQTSRVLGGGYSLSGLVGFLLSQIMGYHPVFTFLGVLGLFSGFPKLASSKNMESVQDKIWIISVLALPVFLFFIYSSMKQFVLLHWTLTVWLLLLPFGWIFIYQRWQKIFKRAVVITAILMSLIVAEFSFQIFSFPDFQSPYTDVMGYSKLRTEVVSAWFSFQAPSTVNNNAVSANDQAIPVNEDKTKANGTKLKFFVAVPNWTLGSRVKYYLEDLAPVFVMDDRKDQFDIWEEEEESNGRGLDNYQEGIFIVAHDYPFSKTKALHDFQCSITQEMATMPVVVEPWIGKSYRAQEFTLYYCFRNKNLIFDGL